MKPYLTIFQFVKPKNLRFPKGGLLLFLIFILVGTNDVKGQTRKDSVSNFWTIITKRRLDSLNKAGANAVYWGNIVDQWYDSEYYNKKLPKYKASMKILTGIRDTITNAKEQFWMDGYISKIKKVDSLSGKNTQLENRLVEFNNKIFLATTVAKAKPAGETFMLNVDKELASYRNTMIATNPGSMADAIGQYLSSNTFTVYLTLDKRYLDAPSIDIFITEDIGTATAQQIADHIHIIPGRIDHYQDFEKESAALRDYFRSSLGFKNYTFEFSLPAFANSSHICPVPDLQKNLQWSVFVFADKYLYAYWPLNGLATSGNFFIPY